MENKNGKGQIVWIPVEKIFPHPYNPRKDLGDLSELTASIASRGVLQNLTVVPRVVGGQEREGEYTSVIGHRRCAAAKAAKLTEVPCVISNMTPKEQFETMMIENVQRNALTVYEQAKGFQMMLDMGDSIEDVAKKTGFSASTIRRRAQLASLDEERFKKTERRGASLEDYLKLSKIEDPKQRDTVLEKIGTAEFNNAYKKAIEDQNFRAFFAKLKIFVREAAWLTKKTNETTGYNGKYEYYSRHGRGYQTMPKEPEGAKPGQYIYVIGEDYVEIYKKRSNKKDATEKLKKKFQDEMNEITVALDKAAKRHKEMRREFIQNFSTFATHEMDITAFAANVMADPENPYPTIEELSKLLGIGTYTPTGKYHKKLKEKDWKSLLFNNPLKALLCVTYVKLEGYNERYHCSSCTGSYGVSVVEHWKNERLTKLYDGLKAIGYEMSEEETLLQTGKHPLFDQAAKLFEAYKEDVKNAKKKASEK